MGFKTRLYTVFALAILLSAVSGITSYHIFQKQATQREWVKRTHRIIDSAKAIQNMVTDMETGRRGFRATNQKRFLEPYITSLQLISPAITGLKDSLSLDPENQKTAILLEQHIHTLMSFWVTNGDDAAQYTLDSITKLTDNEKTQMDDIRSIIATLIKDEDKLLTTRREDYEALIHDATLSAVIGSILAEAIIIILIILVFSEFKRRRKIQEQLNHSVHKLEDQKNELQRSEDELKNALKEVALINKQLEKFVYTVAHDIKSPLGGISGALSILEMDSTIAANPELSSFISLSSQRAAHLSEMVNSILEYSRLSLDKQQVEEVNTGELVNDIATLIFPPQNIQITVAAPMPVLKTKKIKIIEVFQNLISNAIKYNDKKEGYIEIGCNEKETYYEFYVKDNGSGISNEDKPRIFSLFRDGRNRHTPESSTGFGLNIVKLIIEEQGGKIWVESTPGQGSAFYFQWNK